MIGFYVHHHGLGHATRATAIASHLTGPVLGLGSGGRPAGWPGEWVELPLDLSEEPVEPTAGGVLHWAPLDHPGYRQRMALVAGAAGRLDLLVVDVSAEVALLARLMGTRTVVVGMRGERTDLPHELAYRTATGLLVPWSREQPEPWWADEWLPRTCFAGAISRFDHLPPPPPPANAVPTVLALLGSGGSDLAQDYWATAAAATPGWHWVVRGPGEPSGDVWADLVGADVVVCTAGNNAVAEVAAAGRPAVVVAQARPFDEQLATVAALRRAGVCEALDGWPAPGAWPRLLSDAKRRGGAGWAGWLPRDGARRAARFIEQLARPR